MIQAPALDLALELAGGPPRVADREQRLARPRAASDVAERGEHTGRRRQRDVAGDSLGALGGVLRGVQQEALPYLDRPAVVRAHGAGDPAVVAAELPEQGAPACPAPGG